MACRHNVKQRVHTAESLWPPMGRRAGRGRPASPGPRVAPGDPAPRL